MRMADQRHMADDVRKQLVQIIMLLVKLLVNIAI